jgi:toxin ParE1/3/4
MAQKRRFAQLALVANDDPGAAARLDAEIETQADALKANPEMGRLGRLPGTREWVVQLTPYLLVYRVGAGQIDILRVLHGAQRWP